MLSICSCGVQQAQRVLMHGHCHLGRLTVWYLGLCRGEDALVSVHALALTGASSACVGSKTVSWLVMRRAGQAEDLPAGWLHQ